MLEFLDEHVSFSCEFIRTDRLNSISGGSYWDTSVTAPGPATKNTLFGSWTVMGDTRTPIVGFKLPLLDSSDLLVSGKVFFTKMICIFHDFFCGEWFSPLWSRKKLWAIIITKKLWESSDFLIFTQYTHCNFMKHVWYLLLMEKKTHKPAWKCIRHTRPCK